MYRSRLTGLLLLPCCAAIFLAQVSETPVVPIQFRNVASAAGLDFVLENNPTAEKQLIAEAAGSSAVAIPVLEAQDFPFCSSEWHANVLRQTL